MSDNREWLLRTQTLLGEAAMDKLRQTAVAVVGLGGVGGSCSEALWRSGIGHLILVDFDVFDVTNLNRQLLATSRTIGQPKTEACRNRLQEIHTDGKITLCDMRYDAETAHTLFDLKPDFVVDAIDMVSAKLDLLSRCAELGIPSISCMGTGNRLDPGKLHIGTVADTAGCGCGLARVMRYELRKRDLLHQPVLYSTEQAVKVVVSDGDAPGRHAPASISFMPPAAGYFLASYTVRRILGM